MAFQNETSTKRKIMLAAVTVAIVYTMVLMVGALAGFICAELTFK